MDYGKYKYEQSKREKESHKHQQGTKLKEIRIKPNIGSHDYHVKIDQAKKFLEKSYKLKLLMLFRGRQIVHRDIGTGLLKNFIEDLKEDGVPESAPKTIGKMIIITLAPVAKHETQKKQ